MAGIRSDTPDTRKRDRELTRFGDCVLQSLPHAATRVGVRVARTTAVGFWALRAGSGIHCGAATIGILSVSGAVLRSMPTMTVVPGL